MPSMPPRSPSCDDEPVLRSRVHRPGVALVVAGHVAPDAEAERVALAAGVAQLIERNAELRDPTRRVDPRADVPHAVPRLVLFAIVENREVALHAGRIHRELDAGAAIVVAVDDELEPLGLRAHVAPAEQRHDAVGVRIERAHETYRLRASYATRASVRKRGSPFSVGSNVRNPSITCAVAHTASSALPSITGALIAEPRSRPSPRRARLERRRRRSARSACSDWASNITGATERRGEKSYE